jgi:tRNA(Ile)-lysidine synthase TilS/MesJ
MDIKEIERAILKKYRSKLYAPFIRALQEYELIQENDKIAVCVSGGKDSLLLAKLFQELHRHSDVPFELHFIAMDPGFNEENRKALENNCRILNIPIQIKNSNVFQIAQKLDPQKPCYMCAKMRRGFLYEFARELGCNKIALAHHRNDVIETILLNVLYGGKYNTMIPKLKSTNFEGMELIRPLVLVEEKDIINYMNYIEIVPMSCGCPVSANELTSKRKEIKKLIANIKKDFKDVEISIYRSAENVNNNCLLGWKWKEKKYSFLYCYNEIGDEE